MSTEPAMVINRRTLVPIGAAAGVVLGCITILWGVASLQSELVAMRVEMANIGAAVAANTTAVHDLTGAGLVNKTEFAHITEALVEVKVKLAAIDDRLRKVELNQGKGK